VRGEWVRVAEGTWSTQVIEEDFDGTGMKDLYNKFAAHYKVGPHFFINTCGMDR
jgi:hypothetical protein